MVPNVFISHCALDAVTANITGEFLESQDLRCWIAPRDISPGDDPDDAILRGIQGSAVLILIFSQNANRSESVRREVGHAIHAGKLVIPFRIENIPPSEGLEPYLKQRYSHEAHILPIEQHLAELVRILKPLIHRRVVKMADEASISRTLPSRSSIIRSDASNSKDDLEADGPLRISFNFNRVCVLDQVYTFGLVLENTGLEILEDIEIVMENRAIRKDGTVTLSRLAPGHSHRHVMEIEPIRSGHFALQVTATFHKNERQFVLIGSRPLAVHEASGTTGIPISKLVNLELPENLEAVDLSLDYEIALESQEVANSSRSLTIPGAYVSKARFGTLLRLESMETTSDLPHQEIRLVARSSFSLGRLREDSDFLLWFWPRNEVHDTKTRRISKKHCTLITKNGKFYVGNTAAASLTTFDGMDVTGPEGVVLEGRGILNLSGIYFLELTCFASNSSQGPTILNLNEWAGKENASASVSPARGCVRFISKTSHTFPQNSNWLLSDGTFGTSRANPVVLDLAGLAEIQGRFYHFLGGFWIENLMDNAAVEIDGVTLKPGSIAPLVGGTRVKLGQRQYHISVDS